MIGGTGPNMSKELKISKYSQGYLFYVNKSQIRSGREIGMESKSRPLLPKGGEKRTRRIQTQSSSGVAPLAQAPPGSFPSSRGVKTREEFQPHDLNGKP